MDGDKTVTAHFEEDEPITYPLTMAVLPEESGTTAPAIGVHTYPAGTGVPIEAFAEEGYHFVNWTVNAGVAVDDPGSASTSVTMDGDKTVTAHFELITYTLTVGVNPIDSAFNAVVITPLRGAHSGYAYNSTETVFIDTATIPAGWQFVNWTDSVGGTEIGTDPTTGVTVTMNADKTVIANFDNILNYLFIRGYHAKNNCTGLQKTHIETPVVSHDIYTGYWLYTIGQKHPTPNVKNINFIARYDGVSTTIEYRYRWITKDLDGNESGWDESYYTWTTSGSSLVDDETYGYGFASECMYAPSDPPNYYCYQFEIEIAVNRDYVNTYLINID